MSKRMAPTLSILATSMVLTLTPGLARAGVGTAPAGSAAPAAGIGATLVATSLAFPAAFTFAPDGRIFYGERLTGRIRIIDPASGSNTLFFTVPNLSAEGEQGLLGLALHPKYPARSLLFAYVTRIVNGAATNQVVRITDRAGTGAHMKVIFSSNVPANTFHDGGHIVFGPDRKLYAFIGESGTPANSQDPNKDGGKILRMTATGGVPASNPFPGSYVYSFGHRNSFGHTFDPATGYLWEPENGPACNDEINRIRAGQNYGWGPSQTCSTPPPPPVNTNQDGPNQVLPEAWFTPTIAPTGAAFCSGCGLTGSEGTLFFGAYNTGEIRRVVLSADRTSIASLSVVYTHPSGVISVERGPDGALYFSNATAIYKLVQT
jgi:glucose/arabinose dehydrogenase